MMGLGDTSRVGRNKSQRRTASSSLVSLQAWDDSRFFGFNGGLMDNGARGMGKGDGNGACAQGWIVKARKRHGKPRNPKTDNLPLHI
jgi:hypothetical protein